MTRRWVWASHQFDVALPGWRAMFLDLNPAGPCVRLETVVGWLAQRRGLLEQDRVIAGHPGHLVPGVLECPPHPAWRVVPAVLVEAIAVPVTDSPAFWRTFGPDEAPDLDAAGCELRRRWLIAYPPDGAASVPAGEEAT